jgi:hypothetical protein
MLHGMPILYNDFYLRDSDGVLITAGRFVPVM